MARFLDKSRSRMMKVLLSACLLAASLAAQNKPPRQVSESVELKPDIVYAQYGSRAMHLDLYLPKQGDKLPVIVWVHGGGWRTGDKNGLSRPADFMAARGFAGACVEYRLSGEATFPAAIYDTKAAVRWLRANAAKYRIDPNKIGASGGSSGAHLVALLGVSANIAEFEGDLLKHTLATLLIAENGQIVHRADGSAWESKEFVAKMKK